MKQFIMKNLLLLLTLSLSTVLNAQWKTVKGDNGVAYNQNTKGELIKIQKSTDGSIGLLFEKQTTCPFDTFKATVSFYYGEKWHRYTTDASNIGSVVIVVDGFSSDFIKDFKLAEKITFSFENNKCGSELYEFNMSGSTAAFNFIKL